MHNKFFIKIKCSYERISNKVPWAQKVHVLLMYVDTNNE